MGRSPSIVIYGAGAVGGYLGGMLALGNPSANLTLVGRQPTVDGVSKRGLRIREDGAERIARVQAVSSPEELPPADLVVVTVRTYDVAGAIPDLQRLLKGESYVLSMQNGVGAEELLGTAFGRNRVGVGTITAALRTEEPGMVYRTSSAGGLALAPMNGPLPSWVRELFLATGLSVTGIPDYRSLRWSKLLLNMLGAATSAVLDTDLKTVVADRRLFRIEQRAFDEAVRAMDAQHIATISLPGYPVTLARAVMRFPLWVSRNVIGRRLARSRGGASPMMRADLQRGKTEIDALNGAVVRAGEAAQIDVSVNRALTDLIHDLSSHPERRQDFRGRPDALLAYLHEQGVRL